MPSEAPATSTPSAAPTSPRVCTASWPRTSARCGRRCARRGSRAWGWRRRRASQACRRCWTRCCSCSRMPARAMAACRRNLKKPTPRYRRSPSRFQRLRRRSTRCRRQGRLGSRRRSLGCPGGPPCPPRARNLRLARRRLQGPRARMAATRTQSAAAAGAPDAEASVCPCARPLRRAHRRSARPCTGAPASPSLGPRRRRGAEVAAMPRIAGRSYGCLEMPLSLGE
mmetsp:Transcript_89374/g.289016  ORF Transcript_89374/g.289016 Transcript_89374/m.289016 type:complete len:226 (-) Transcript_89374:56-733(-)